MSSDAKKARVDALKITLNVLGVVATVWGLLNLRSSSFGVAEGFGFALACFISRAILDRLDAIKAAIEAKTAKTHFDE